MRNALLGILCLSTLTSYAKNYCNVTGVTQKKEKITYISQVNELDEKTAKKYRCEMTGGKRI